MSVPLTAPFLGSVLDRYYIENVIGGPGSFVIPAKDFTDFKAAILSKLIREIAGIIRRVCGEQVTLELRRAGEDVVDAEVIDDEDEKK